VAKFFVKEVEETSEVEIPIITPKTKTTRNKSKVKRSK
jgi:hypothetical protein